MKAVVRIERFYSAPDWCFVKKPGGKWKAMKTQEARKKFKAKGRKR